jgi:predicted nucleic acid-binding Zn ribbon protein
MGVNPHAPPRGVMAGYQYRCATHGFINTQFRIGTAPASLTCESCRAPARRVFSLPALTTRSNAGLKALDMHEKSRSSPGLVTRSTDPAGSPRSGIDPRHNRLPRP